MNILFSINRSFLDIFFNCIKSVRFNGGADFYNFYIMHSDLTDDDRAQITAAAGETNECNFIYVKPEIFADFPVNKRYPQQIYYRIAAPLLLPPDLDRILYLDADLVVINPLNELYNWNFSGNYYLACTHTKKILTGFNRLRLGHDVNSDVPYINTGVLLMNLSALRENLRLQDVRDYAEEHTLLLPDQDIITGLYGEKIGLLDTLIYNINDLVLAKHNADLRNNKLDVDWVRQNSVIVHYFGRMKPWKSNYIGVLDVFYHEIVNVDL